MGTRNFHSVNASKVFSVLTGECEEWEYKHLIDNLTESLGKDPEFCAGIGKDEHELRSFPSTVIGTTSKNKYIAGVMVEVELTCIIRSG